MMRGSGRPQRGPSEEASFGQRAKGTGTSLHLGVGAPSNRAVGTPCPEGSLLLPPEDLFCHLPTKSSLFLWPWNLKIWTWGDELTGSWKARNHGERMMEGRAETWWHRKNGPRMLLGGPWLLKKKEGKMYLSFKITLHLHLIFLSATYL